MRCYCTVKGFFHKTKEGNLQGSIFLKWFSKYSRRTFKKKNELDRSVEHGDESQNTSSSGHTEFRPLLLHMLPLWWFPVLHITVMPRSETRGLSPRSPPLDPPMLLRLAMRFTLLVVASYAIRWQVWRFKQMQPIAGGFVWSVTFSSLC